MSPYTKPQIAAMEREKMLRDAWNQAGDKTPEVQSPWVKHARENGKSRDSRVAVWGWVAVVTGAAIMFGLGALFHAAFL